MTEPLKILMLEDSVTDADIVQRLLAKEKMDFEFSLALNKDSFLQALDQFSPNVILADNSLPQFDAREALKIIHQRSLNIPFILVTGSVSEEFAASIIKLGADDYILKDRLVRLPAAIDAALKQQRAEKEKQDALREIEVLSMIAKETNNGVMIFDTKTGHTLWVNEGFTRLTGYTQEDMYGKDPLLILQGPETDQDMLDFMRIWIKNNSPYFCDILFHSKTGEPKWQYVSGQPIREDNGQVSKYFVIATDISERRRMEEERLTTKIEQQKEVSRAILQTQEMERNSLGRELHDNINQILASVNLKLGYYLEEPENNIEIIENCRENLQKAIQEARNLSHQMVMPRFSEKKLQDELKILIENYSYKQIVQLELNEMNEEAIPSAIKETLFRIVQEQLSNIHKHAKADRIVIRLSNDSHLMTMFIKDNGIGFDMQQQRKGIGITNIFNRAEAYNGTTDINSAPGKGCTLLVKIPLPGSGPG